MSGFIAPDDPEGVKEMIKLAERQEDLVVAKIKAFSYDDHFGEQIETTCHECERDFVEGEVVYLWGVPPGDTKEVVKAATIVLLHAICSEDCLNAALEEWAEKLQCEVAAAIYS